VLSSCTLIEALSTIALLTKICNQLTIKGAQNSTQTMCGAPVRDITHITPIVTGISGGFAIIGVLVRGFASGGRLELDDIFAIAALISALPMGILEFFMSSDGFGKDIWTIEPSNIYRIVKVNNPPAYKVLC
jgi:hypothetical protein